MSKHNQKASKKRIDLLTPHERQSRKARKIYVFCAVVLVLSVMLTLPASAATDPLTSINNLSDFVFSCIKAIGVILLGFGIVQIGMSLKGHDPGQRANGFMCFFGGLLIAFAKEILDLVVA